MGRRRREEEQQSFFDIHYLKGEEKGSSFLSFLSKHMQSFFRLPSILSHTQKERKD